MIIIILLAIIALGIGAYALDSAYANHAAMTIRLAEIDAAHQEAMAPWIFAGIVVVALAAILIFYFRRPAPPPQTINDNRTVYLITPGESKRLIYKSLGSFNALPLAEGEPTKRLEKQPVKLLGRGQS